jgi:two-component system chemotaxis response regulator CheB
MNISGPAPIKVLIVDDSLFIRSLVSDFLNKDPQLKVVDTAKSGEEAIKKIPHLRPDCIVLDLAMPGWDGKTVLKHIMHNFPTPVVILSA